MIDFDLQSYEKKVAPTGRYLVRVMGIPELKETKSNTGKYLEVNCKVIDGFMSGHMMSKKFNLYNINPTAERIAREQFLSFCKAAGVHNIKTYAQLDGCNAIANVSETFYQDRPKNEIDSFEKYEGIIKPQAVAVNAVVEDKFNDAIPF